MRALLAILLMSGISLAQSADQPKPADSQAQNPAASSAPAAPAESTTPAQETTPAASAAPAPAESPTPAAAATAPGAAAAAPAPKMQPAPADANAITIPAGTKIPLSLAQAISTKNAREGDAVYATTAFPFVMNDHIIIPAGAYIQGTISHTERAGHGHGRAEILVHFTSIIFPSGYTVMLPGAVQNTPGADSNSVKDQEGTIQEDKDTGKRVEDAAKNGVYGTLGGATAGGLATGSLNGARVGAGAGAAAGIAWALLKRGPDVKLEVGTSIEMEIQRAITLDGSRITVAKAGS
jgi:hypothetical protein